MELPRDRNGDRRLSTQDTRRVARQAHVLGRITRDRLNLIEAAMTLLDLIEKESR